VPCCRQWLEDLRPDIESVKQVVGMQFDTPIVDTFVVHELDSGCGESQAQHMFGNRPQSDVLPHASTWTLFQPHNITRVNFTWYKYMGYLSVKSARSTMSKEVVQRVLVVLQIASKTFRHR
jgi:hypothetical protein